MVRSLTVSNLAFRASNRRVYGYLGLKLACPGQILRGGSRRFIVSSSSSIFLGGDGANTPPVQGAVRPHRVNPKYLICPSPVALRTPRRLPSSFCPDLNSFKIVWEGKPLTNQHSKSVMLTASFTINGGRIMTVIFPCVTCERLQG
jgi:hypothetical protein